MLDPLEFPVTHEEIDFKSILSLVHIKMEQISDSEYAGYLRNFKFNDENLYNINVKGIKGRATPDQIKILIANNVLGSLEEWVSKKMGNYSKDNVEKIIFNLI